MTYDFSKTRPLILATGALWCLTASQHLLAADPATGSPNVIYTATGVFAATPISGFDFAGLAGQPFTIQVEANESLAPTSSGPNWAEYTGVTMTATIQSSEQQPPLTFQNRNATFALAVGNPAYDVFAVAAPVHEHNLNFWVRFQAQAQLPKGTLASSKILPFTAPYTVTLANPATFTLTCPFIQFPWCEELFSSTLGIASGTLTTSVK